MKAVHLLSLGLFGMVGIYLRFGIHKLFPPTAGLYPYSTFAVNLLGSFAIGFVIFSAENKWNLSAEWVTVITVGFLGGLTTFSAFSMESFKLFERASYLQGAIYLFGTPVLGVLGVYLAKKLTEHTAG